MISYRTELQIHPPVSGNFIRSGSCYVFVKSHTSDRITQGARAVFQARKGDAVHVNEHTLSDKAAAGRNQRTKFHLSTQGLDYCRASARGEE